MGCIFRLTTIVALATGINVSLANETFAYPASQRPEAFSGQTELLNQQFSNSENSDGVPNADRGSGGRLVQTFNAEQDGIPDADGDTGSR